MKLNLEQRDAAIASHMPLAARKHAEVPSVDVDELRSAAYLGLVEAASRPRASAAVSPGNCGCEIRGGW